MKKVMILFLSVFFLLTISSCRTVYRVYQDDDLETLAMSRFGFDSYEIFKIIDADTARYLTNKEYQNSGVIIGIKNSEYKMIFVPRKLSEEPYILQNISPFNLEEIYLVLEDFVEDPIFLEDYGGLSLEIYPYNDIIEKNPSLSFDSQIFYMVTTDGETFYANYVNGSLVIFDTEFKLIYS